MAIEYWTQKDGTRISVDDMDEAHVRNALKMLIRTMRGKTGFIKRKPTPSAAKLSEMIVASNKEKELTIEMVQASVDAVRDPEKDINETINKLKSQL